MLLSIITLILPDSSVCIQYIFFVEVVSNKDKHQVVSTTAVAFYESCHYLSPYP